MGALRLKLIDWTDCVHEYGGSGVLFTQFTIFLTKFAVERGESPLTENRATDLVVGPCDRVWCVRVLRPASVSGDDSVRSDYRNSFGHKVMCVDLFRGPNFQPIGTSPSMRV
jgi:hypothetical protein